MTWDNMEGKLIVMIPTWLEAREFMKLHGETYEVVKAGVGLAECAARTADIISRRKPDLLILAGFAGAYLGKGLRKGQSVLVSRENSRDLGSLRGNDFHPISKDGGTPSDNFYLCKYPLPNIFPSVVSNSVNMAAINHGNDLLMGGDIENMEGASFFAVCNALGVRSMELRIITNIVGAPLKEWIIDEAPGILAEDLRKLIGNIDIRKSSQNPQPNI